jgi:hypothetical protein
VKGERLFVSWRTLYKSIKAEKNPESLDHHGPKMVARHARFSFAKQELCWEEHIQQSKLVD